MAHLAALSLHVHRDVLADSKTAPDGFEDCDARQTSFAWDADASEVRLAEDLSNFFDAFISNKNSQKSSNLTDESTDSGSDKLNKSEDSPAD